MGTCIWAICHRMADYILTDSLKFVCIILNALRNYFTSIDVCNHDSHAFLPQSRRRLATTLYVGQPLISV